MEGQSEAGKAAVVNYLTGMSNADLLSATADARTAAHQAPLGEKTDANKHGKPTGERFITNHTSGYAHRANDWIKLSDECVRRGLKSPPCNCPAGSHPDWAKAQDEVKAQFSETLEYLGRDD